MLDEGDWGSRADAATSNSRCISFSIKWRPRLGMARIGLRGLAVMVRLGDLDAGRQPLLLLFRERDVVDALAEAHHEGGNVGVFEHLHLVIADEDGDVGPRRREYPRHFRHGALPSDVALLLGGSLDVLMRVSVGDQRGPLPELYGG